MYLYAVLYIYIYIENSYKYIIIDVRDDSALIDLRLILAISDGWFNNSIMLYI